MTPKQHDGGSLYRICRAGHPCPLGGLWRGAPGAFPTAASHSPGRKRGKTPDHARRKRVTRSLTRREFLKDRNES
jgi:hypothetical protein